MDLRSDTVTRPTPAMRRAMADAEVGDDGYGEDPTVNRLQGMFAERMGQEAALLVPSGTMANQIAIRLLSRPGTTVLAGRSSHIVAYENAAAGTNATVQLLGLDDGCGTIAPADVVSARQGVAHHLPVPSMVSIENTHMASGGLAWTPEALAGLVRSLDNLVLHIDGARIFNAHVALGVEVPHLVKGAATVMACLSKGLCAPVGSLLAGSTELMAAARVERQRLGGAMRQAGVIAAAGIVALDTMVERLEEDHARAEALGDVVRARWRRSELGPVQTNIVVFRHEAALGVVEHLASRGVLAGTIAPGVVRLVTHHDVDDAGLEVATNALMDCPL